MKYYHFRSEIQLDHPVGRHHGDEAEEEEPGDGPHAGDRRRKDVAEDEEAEKGEGRDAKGPVE